MGPLLPEQGAKPAFAQLYILDPDAANSRRLEIFPDLSREVLDKLDQMLRQHNGFVSIFERAVQTSNQENKPELKLVLNADMTTVPDPRRYNVPASNGLAAFIPDGMLPEVNCRQIALNVRGGGMKFIDDLHHDYDPLYFVLLFPRGEAGWSPYIPLMPKTSKVGEDGDNSSAVMAHEANEDDDEEGDEEEGNQHRYAEDDDHALNNDETEAGTTANAGITTTSTSRRSKCVTALQFYKFLLQIREDDFNTLLRFGRLTQEFIVDMFAKIENSRLSYIRFHQDDLRVDVYAGASDYVRRGDGQAPASNLGQPTILPSSFQGGPRYMQQCYQDAMAIVRRYGKPDYFITFTCNPNWVEIKANLMPRQSAVDRPDLVCRVFHLKLKALLKDLSDGVLGRMVSLFYVIEFQKRGLPHAHILMIVAPEDKLRDPEMFDFVTCAELPDRLKDPELFQIVLSCMVHTPCGDYNPNACCMKDGKCSKRYPRPFCETTTDSADGYPIYRRRNNGATHTCVKNGQMIVIDNQWVVPYNPCLSKKYNAHINVEVCANVQAIKYLYKYLTKGNEDRSQGRLDGPTAATTGTVQEPPAPVDEISEFQEGRFVSGVEGTWRIYEYPMNQRIPNVVRLEVHLEDQQTVFFR
jgi:hypothetical protein